MLNDLRHGVRLLFAAKGWTVVVLLSLALGIGANTAFFSAMNGLLLRTLPVEDPDSLVRLRWAGPNDMVTNSSDYGFSAETAAGEAVRATFSYPMFEELRAQNRTMTDLAACAPLGQVNLTADGRAEIATALVSTGNYYQILGAKAAVGRLLGTEDDKPGAPPAAVISARYWRSRFGGDAGIVGRTVNVNSVPVTLVGVVAPEFVGIQQTAADPPDVGLPLALDARIVNAATFTGDPGARSRISQPTSWWLQIMGRRKPGVTAAQVKANLEGLFQQTARAGLAQYLASATDAVRAASDNQNRTRVPHLLVDSGSRGVYDVNTADLREVAILMAVAALVLLIVCANVANLLLSRAAGRRKELSIRLSLGATRGRLVRQLLTESVLVASLGGALGVVAGFWGQQLLPGAPGRPMPLDWRVVGFAIAATTVSGVVFGIAPALRATGMNLSTSLKESSRSVAGARSVLTRALLVSQIAVSLVLLVGAGLFLRTLVNLRRVDVGFDPRNLVLFRVNPQLNQYDAARSDALYSTLLDRLRTVPGVRAAALSQPPLLSGGVSSTRIVLPGETVTRRDASRSINRLVVSPNFFDAMGFRLVAGRVFDERDAGSSPKVVIVNEAAVRKYLPPGNPLGQRFGSSPETSRDLEIVGVVADTKYNSLRDPAPPTMYVPYPQAHPVQAAFEVRTAADPLGAVPSIRDAVHQVDPDLPLIGMSTQAEQIERRFAQEKVFAQAYALFGGLALVVASVGLFGVMSYSVSRRTNEIGIRMALGAERRDVLRLVIGESMALVVAGMAIGTAAALAAGRLVASLIYGLAPTDAVTFALAMVVMFVVSAVAGYLPARRASRVDPLVALRCE